MATTEVALLTFEQFMDLPDQEGVGRELDEGVLIEMPNPSFAHGAIVARINRWLGNHIDESGAEFEVSGNTDFRLAPDTVRAPDVCLVRRSALEKMPVERGVLVGCPDLAVEVVSPSETATDLNRKVEQYLRHGATAVWVAYQSTRQVMVFRRNGETRRLGIGQVIEEPELLPGLRIPVEKIFP